MRVLKFESDINSTKFSANSADLWEPEDAENVFDIKRADFLISAEEAARLEKSDLANSIQYKAGFEKISDNIKLKKQNFGSY